MVAIGGGLCATTEDGVYQSGNFHVDPHFEKCLGGEGVVPVGGRVVHASVLGKRSLMLCALHMLRRIRRLST